MKCSVCVIASSLTANKVLEREPLAASNPIYLHCSKQRVVTNGCVFYMFEHFSSVPYKLCRGTAGLSQSTSCSWPPTRVRTRPLADHVDLGVLSTFQLIHWRHTYSGNMLSSDTSCLFLVICTKVRSGRWPCTFWLLYARCSLSTQINSSRVDSGVRSKSITAS